MIDVNTYLRLPKDDRDAIDEWLQSVLVKPMSLRCTEVEMVDEAGSCRIRHHLVDGDGGPIFVGDEPATADHLVDAHLTVFGGARPPSAVCAFGPGPNPPEPELIARYREARP